MRMFFHVLAFECRRMRLLLLLWLGMNLWLLHRTFSKLSEDSLRLWEGRVPLLFFAWLTGTGLFLTTGRSPANPTSLLRLRPAPPRVITLARMGLVFGGVLLPSLACALVLYLWISPGLGTILTATQTVLLRVLMPALAAAAMGTRRNTLPDAIVLTTVFAMGALLLYGAAEFLQVTRHVQDGALCSAVWTMGFTLLIIALLLYDWYQTDLGRSPPAASRTRFAALGTLYFLLFALDFENDPVNYGHPPRNPEVKAETLAVRIRPKRRSYQAVLRREDGSSTFVSPVPSADIQTGGTWYFQGEVEVEGLPPGVAFVARVEESVWRPESGNPITASFRDHNMATRFFNHRLPPPLISAPHLRPLLTGTQRDILPGRHADLGTEALGVHPNPAGARGIGMEQRLANTHR